MTKRAKKLLGIVIAAAMMFALCLPVFTACKPDEPETPVDPTEMELTDGYFEGASSGMTWVCVLKENGTYYFQSITGSTAGTWEEVNEEIEYISNILDGDATNPDQTNPVYATAERGVRLNQYGGDSQTVAYADGKLWNVIADYGMSMRNLTQKNETWDENSERDVTVLQYYDQKDSAKSVQLIHNFTFRDSLNGIRGTWENGASDGAYTLTTSDGETGYLTVSSDGASAEYTLGGETVTLYKTSFSPVYEFTATADLTLKGETESSELAFRLALYDNGDGETYDGDADISFYDEDDNLIQVDSGRYTYDDAEKTFTFTDFENEVNDQVVTANAGEYTYVYTDAADGLFEPIANPAGDPATLPATVSMTYKLPPVYTMTAALPDGADNFASVNIGGEGMDLTLTDLTLEIYESGDAYMRGEIMLGPTLSAVMGAESFTAVLDEGTVERSGNLMTITFANGAEDVTTAIDTELNRVVSSGYSTKEPIDVAAATGLPLPIPVTYTLSGITFSMNYTPAALYEFRAQGEFVYSKVGADDGYMPTDIVISVMDNGTYQLVNILHGVGQLAQSGTWAMNEDGSVIDFTKTDGTEVTFSAAREGSNYVIELNALEIGKAPALPTDYGTLTGTFVAEGSKSVIATLEGETSSENFGTLSAMGGVISGTVDGVSLVLYSDGTAEVQAAVSFAAFGIVGVPGGTLDKGTYTVDGNTYTFTFEGAGTVTGTLSGSTLTLTYAPAATAHVVYTAPDELAAVFGAAGEIGASGISCTLSGTIA